jgi:hypothetical protein
VADRVDAAKRRRDQAWVGEVAVHEFRVGAEILGRSLVGSGQQRIEHTHLVPLGEKPVGDMGADEAGPAGEQDHRRDGRASRRRRKAVRRRISLLVRSPRVA